MATRSATHGTFSSRTFHASPRAPPGRRTRLASRNASTPSNQWNAVPTTTASTDASGTGSASAVPSRMGVPGSARMKAARMSGTGSMPVTCAPVGRSKRASLPVPAPTSSTCVPGPRRRRLTRQLIASTGYSGRPVSYTFPAVAKPCEAIPWIVFMATDPVPAT